VPAIIGGVIAGLTPGYMRAKDNHASGLKNLSAICRRLKGWIRAAEIIGRFLLCLESLWWLPAVGHCRLARLQGFRD